MRKQKLTKKQGRITLEEIGFTEIELKRIEALVRFRSYKTAAKFLHCSVEAMRGTTFQLRMKKIHVNYFNKKYEEYRRKLGVDKTYLNINMVSKKRK